MLNALGGVLKSMIGGDGGETKLDGAATAAKSANAFGIALFQQVHKESDNVFVSPASIQLALAMALNGAAGDTLAQMLQTMQLETGGKDLETVNLSFAQLLQELSKTKSPVTLAIANSIWGNHFDQEFNAVLAKTYQTRAYPMASAAKINTWCAEQTNNRIPTILQQDPEEDDLVLVNGIYFKAPWQTTFDEKLTENHTFVTSGGKKLTVPMMYIDRDADNEYKYADVPEGQLLEMPYAGGTFSAIVMLPGKSMDDVVGSLSLSKWGDWMGRLGQAQPMEGTLVLPKFKAEFEVELSQQLSKMGMPLAFSDRAQFPKMSHEKEMKIDVVIHKTFVEVTEQGTEAAAVTLVGMVECSSFDGRPRKPRFYMVCDHTFLFAIRHQATGALIFLGKIDAPAA